MNTRKDDPIKDKRSATTGGSVKKPYMTLDLKADEVKTAAPASQTAATTTAASGASGTSAASAAAASKSTAAPAGSSGSGGSGTPSSGKSAAPPPPSRGSGGSTIGRLFTHTLAGVVGGFLALLGADTLGPQLKELGISGGYVGTQASDEVRQRLAALEQRVSGSARGTAAGGEVSQKLAQAEARIADLEKQAKSLDQVAATASKAAADAKALQNRLAQQPAGGGASPQTVARIAKLEDTLSTLSAAGSDPQSGRLPQLAAITGRIKDLETALETKLSGLRTTVNESIDSRLGQAAEAAEAARSGTQRIDRDLTGVRTEAARITQRVEALKSDADRLSQTLRVVQQETGGLKSALDAFKGDVSAQLKTVAKPADVDAAVAPVAQKLSSLETSLQGIVRSEEDRRVNAERIVLSLELANLKRVLDRGQSYASELAEVKKAANGRIDLAALETYKGQGVPTLPELIREFRPVSGRIMDASLEPADGSVLDRLLAGAKSIVRVRKTDVAPSDKSTEAVVARMENALKENRLGDVLAEAKALSAEEQATAKTWLGRVAARAEVERALAQVDSQLKASLAGARAPAAKSN